LNSDSARSNKNQLPYRLVPLTVEQSSLLLTQDSVLFGEGNGGPNGTVLVGVSPGLCEEVTRVELHGRTIVVVLQKPVPTKNQICAAMRRHTGVEVTVVQPIDGVSTVSRTTR
jgi:hypothetical protein